MIKYLNIVGLISILLLTSSFVLPKPAQNSTPIHGKPLHSESSLNLKWDEDNSDILNPLELSQVNLED